MSNYFSHFPKVSYDISNNGDSLNVVNIMKRFVVDAILNRRLSVFYDYDIRDGDRPDTIAHKYYGDSKYDWVILLVNDIIDPMYDWPLEQNNFNNFIINKYGSIADAQSQVHHYEKIIRATSTNTFGTHLSEIVVEVDAETYNATPVSERRSVSSYDFEEKLNESKRTIKILDKAHLSKVISEADGIFE